jgi:hypothetical protein
VDGAWNALKKWWRMLVVAGSGRTIPMVPTFEWVEEKMKSNKTLKTLSFWVYVKVHESNQSSTRWSEA